MDRDLTLQERVKEGWKLRDSKNPLDWIKYKLYYDPSNGSRPRPISGILKTFGPAALGAGLFTAFIPTAVTTATGVAGGYVGSKIGGAVGSILPTKSKVTQNINKEAGETVGSLALSLPFGKVGSNLLDKNYRLGLSDWFKYRNVPTAKSVLDEHFASTIQSKPGVQYPDYSTKMGWSPKTKYYKTSTPHGDVVYGIDKENNGRILAKVFNDGSWEPYGTVFDNPYVFRPHWSRPVSFVLNRTIDILPHGSYLVDSNVAPFGAQLRNASKLGFAKLLFTGPKTSYMNSFDAQTLAPNSFSSYKDALKKSVRPGYSLRYNEEYVPHFNNNDLDFPTAYSIDLGLLFDKSHTVHTLNNMFQEINPDFQPITITNGKVNIPIPVVLKK